MRPAQRHQILLKMRPRGFWVRLLPLVLLLLTACADPLPQGPAATAVSTRRATAEPTPAATATDLPATPAAAPTAEPLTAPTANPTATPERAQPTAVPTLAPTPTPCAEPGRVEQATIDSVIAGEFAYRIYLPPCYGLDGRTYPTLYLLPGNIHDDSIWDVLGADEAADAAIAAGDIQPLLIVMPDGGQIANETSGGPTSYEGLLLSELIPVIEQAYCAEPSNDARAIGGLSRGGYWSLTIAFRHPGEFRSVGAHSPALVDTHAGPGVDPVQTAATNDLSDLRIAIDIGERDPYLVQARPLHEALDSAGVEHVWQINEGTHDNAYWMEHVPDYLRWYDSGWSVDRDNRPRCTPAPG